MKRNTNATAALLASLRDQSLLRTANLIDGRWVPGDAPGTPVHDPATGELVATVAELGEAQLRSVIDATVDAAAAAMSGWKETPARERARVLRRWHDLIIENADDLATILTLEQGKPLAEARGEIVANAAYLEWFAEECKRAYGDVVPSLSANQRVVVLKEPVGVCAAITPWNFPNGMITRKVGPAIAAGCSIVLKPATQTPLSALALGELSIRAGIPPGVFSVVTGPAERIGQLLCTHPRIAKLSFTGSTRVGRALLSMGADTVKKMTLELGGNAPFIVFEDADLDLAVREASDAKFRNAGQTCVAPNRFLVHASLAESFIDRLAQRAGSLVLGHGAAADTQMGPLIDERAVERMVRLVGEARGQGARIVVGGRRSDAGPRFFEPTVLTHVHGSMRVACEEIFGPIAPVQIFHDESEAIELANSTEHGLAAYFFTKDLARAWRAAAALQCGIVGINSGFIANEAAPFGGVKQSGMGREGSRHGLDAFMETKYLCMSALQETRPPGERP